MKSHKFLIICFSLFAGFGLTYFIIIDSYVIYERLVPKSYKQFLLEGLADYPGKIIIIGGSDARHGIDALEMENYFKVPVINIGIDATYPLRHKIFNLKKHIQPGDIVIFSLAWVFYLEDGFIANTYLKSVVDKQVSLSFYYKNLPLYEKTKFIFFELPYTLALKSIFSRPGLAEKTNYQISALRNFKKQIFNDRGDARGSAVSNGPVRMNNIIKSLTCDQLNFFKHFTQLIDDREKEKEIIRHLLKGDPKLLTTAFENIIKEGKPANLTDAKPTKTLLDNLQLIGSIKKAGAKVYFAWPIVADSEESKCYESEYSNGIESFVQKIKNLVIKHGYSFLGEYNDSHFSQKCFLDSYVHIKYECASQLTKRLIMSLVEKGVEPKNNGYSRHDFDTKLNNIILKSHKALLDNISLDMPED